MRNLALSVFLAACVAAAAPSAEAAPAAPLDIREGPMAAALADLARQAQIELLFDHKLVRGLTARPVRGRLSGEAALSRLLAGSGVGYRTTPDGAFVLFAIPTPAPRPPQASDGAVAELLVVGRRTQNVDIRRTENDIQPYQVFGRPEIETAARDTVEEFLRARATADTQAGPLTLAGFDNRSAIDLRGFGETSTLVLVDGRRMPFFPSQSGDFNQADINGVPPGAVERIEVLTTTAGGIYGPGAVGGVVNVVLRRDYRGADLTAYAGGSDRGDAGNFRLEGRLGFTPDDGQTDVMLFVSHSEATPLRTGRRDYVERAGRIRFANDPDDYVVTLPIRNGVSVASRAGDLTLSPEYGGAALGARFTYLPVGFTGTSADAAALLQANAGKLPEALSDDRSGKRGYIATVPSATSGLLNVRRRIRPGVEVFVDGLWIRNAGRWAGAAYTPILHLDAGEPGNPFDQNINVTFPMSLLDEETTYRFDVSRWTAGGIVDLPHGWKASADYTIARSQVRRDSQTVIAGFLGGVGGGPSLAPFGDWSSLVASVPGFVAIIDRSLHLDDRLRDASLRISGPVLTLPGGPLTATLLGEEREDRVAAQQSGSAVQLPPRVQRVRSAYAELRAPLGASDADNILLRGLEVQLAARHDRTLQQGPVLSLTLYADAEPFSVRDDATMFTAGARVLPMSKLMLRASVATGERPPTLSNFQAVTLGKVPGTTLGQLLGTGVLGQLVGTSALDPRRGGQPLGADWTNISGGSTRIGSAQARSFTIGAVVNPEGRGGPRVSLDYSRIVVSDEPAPFPLTPEQLLAAEAQYPDRVVRAPLTEADVAAGFTVGRVIALDTSTINIGRTIVEAVDLQFDWLLPPLDLGDFRLYGALTWQPTFSTRQSPSAETIDWVGTANGPLEWRGNAGVEWVRGPLTVDLNAQYYGSYSFQGEPVPAQTYVDLSLRRLFTAPFGPGPLRTLEARISIQNLLDKSPPIVASSTNLGFSEYGDPRRRRVAAALSARF